MKMEAGKAYRIHFGGLRVERPGKAPVTLEGPAPFGIGVRTVFVERRGHKWTRMICPHTLRGGRVRTDEVEHLLDAVQSGAADTDHVVLLMDEKRVLMDAALAMAERVNKRAERKGLDRSAHITLPYTPPVWIRNAITAALGG